ncbi:MAG: glycoside hydrolase family 5 protein [Ruminococcus flavefaciens]|nr:glycoside hydrolase family 5 protein [Ruminococcus flavefaciens]MCM1229430.1 glycoside hydrolase family 5 protein [Ruminococcus flavefaciens]
MFKSKITRIISMVSATACMATCINFAPVDISEAVEVKSAFEITEDMGLGWNLGNSLDSYASKPKLDENGNTVYDEDGNIVYIPRTPEEVKEMGIDTESVWGNPNTTKQMIETVKAKGFNTIRVPVSWFQHVDSTNSYKISDEYLARVKEVVDYCYNNDMYVILNLHHEEGWQNRSTLGSDYEEINGYVTSLWKQLAEAFKDYDQHLIFETMNEPRATQTDHEWWGPTDSEVDTINKINANSLEVIRNAGGQNNTRLVMMPGYCASSDVSMMSKVVIPDDDYVAASVHAYSPYSFAMDDNVADHSVFTEANKNELINIMDGIRKTFSDKDIPVVLGEFSASNFGNTEARCDWAEVYMETTKAYGFPCVLWDNNVASNGGGEAHGYLNRSNCTWYEASEPVIDTMLKVLDDSSIVWGSARKSPVITHDDITTGKQLIDTTYSLDSSVENGGCTPSLDVTWKDLEGGDVAIKYTGETPVIAVVDSNWKHWTEIKPYDDADGIAYYSSEHIKAACTGTKDDLDSPVPSPEEIEHIFARTNGITTIEAMAVIGAADVSNVEPEPQVPIYTADLSKTDGKTLTFTVKGTAGSTVNGCVGYMADEWSQIEWADKIGDDGTVTITVDTSVIPSSISSAQVQIWWCDDKNAEITINYEGETPVETTTASSVVNPGKYLAGDANEDGAVDVADAAAIIQSLGNKDKYALSEQGAINAEVDGVEGITGMDAITIQKVAAHMINLEDLPLKAS